MSTHTVDDVVRLLENKCTVQGSPAGKTFANVRPINEADDQSLVWVSPTRPDRDQLVAATKARIVICDATLALNEQIRADKCFVVVDKPKLAYLRVVESWFVIRPPWGIHPTAFVHPEARLAEHVYVGPFTYVGNSAIGEGSRLFGQCFVYDGVVIGKNVEIHAGTVIGSDGFGYARNEQGEFEKFPHIGGVVIEDNVDIGANTCIDRGTLGNTLIKEGAKIDNLVHIAHNVVVGRHAAVIADAMVGGSTIIDDFAWIAPSAALMNQARIGKWATIGMGAVVTKDVPDGETWAGSPARPIKEFVAIQKKLRELK